MDGVWRRTKAADGTITCSSKLEGGKQSHASSCKTCLSATDAAATPIITYSPQNGITVLAKRRPGPPRSFYMNVVYTKMGNGAIYTFSVRKADFKSVDEIYPLSLSIALTASENASLNDFQKFHFSPI